MPLTDVQIRNAKPGEKSWRLADGQGLYLYVSTSGAKSWRYDYAYFGKRKTLTFGSYPTLSLAEARERLREAKKSLSDGADPSLAKKREQMAAKAIAEIPLA